jgi:hypothetical protein
MELKSRLAIMKTLLNASRGGVGEQQARGYAIKADERES